MNLRYTATAKTL